MVFDNVLFLVISSYFTILRSNNTKGGYCYIYAIVHLFCVINLLDEHFSKMSTSFGVFAQPYSIILAFILCIAFALIPTRCPGYIVVLWAETPHLVRMCGKLSQHNADIYINKCLALSAHSLFRGSYFLSCKMVLSSFYPDGCPWSRLPWE